MTELSLNLIRTDGRTQARAAINSATVCEYAQLYSDGAELSPLVVYFDGKDHWLADGFHRYHAARRAALRTLPCDVQNGTLADARWHAVGANKAHGLQRTPADKREAVTLAIKERPHLSDREIASHAGVGADLVGSVRAQLSANDSSLSPPTRVGKDGKERRLPCPPPPPPPPPIPDPPRPALPPPPGLPPAPAATPPAPAAAPPDAAPPPERKPQEPHGRDAVGRVIPDVCAEVFDRADEAKRLLAAVSEVRVALRRAVQAHDPLYAEVNASAVMADLDRAYDLLAVAVPYAVCPSCQGNAKLTGCRLCSGRGAISRFKWDTCVPEEAKSRIGGLRK